MLLTWRFNCRKRQFRGIIKPYNGVFSMGRSSGGDYSANVMDYVTIGSTGNATDFGDLSVVRISTDGASSNTRGLFMGGLMLLLAQVRLIEQIQ